ERVLLEYPESRTAIDLMRQSGERLDAILTDEADAREVLFAPAALAAWARIFVDLPWAAYYNTLVAEAIAAAVEEVPASARLRVLEIGAGTAATTISVLPRLEGRSAEYSAGGPSRKSAWGSPPGCQTPTGETRHKR